MTATASIITINVQNRSLYAS